MKDLGHWENRQYEQGGLPGDLYIDGREVSDELHLGSYRRPLPTQLVQYCGWDSSRDRNGFTQSHALQLAISYLI